MRLSRLLAVAVTAATALLASAPVSAQQPTRDTVVVIRRDTLVVIQRDTVFVAPAPERAGDDRPADPRPERDPYQELEDARAARRARLEQLRAEREERLRLLGDARDSEHALAYYFYPTRLLEIDFPAATLGVAYAKDGRVGGMASVGVLTRPINDFRNIPAARGPIRGLDLGAEFRYYVSPRYKRFPMFVGGGGSYSWAPVEYEAFIFNPEGTFERLSSADATGRRIRANLLIGWELRTGSFALDLTTGIEFHARGIFTDNQELARSLEGPFLFDNLTRVNQYNPALYPVMRVGVGIGSW